MIESPEIEYLGSIPGQWPVHAFVSRALAEVWAHNTPDGVLWHVDEIKLGPALRPRIVPARVELYDPTGEARDDPG